MTRKVWWNGRFIDESEARISIYDSALMFGDMAFEMMRTFNKQTFMLWEHLYRLEKSMKILEIEIPYTLKELHHLHENLILHNRGCFTEDDEVRTLINVSRGTLPIYQPFIGGGESNVIIACFPLSHVIKGKSKFYDIGVHAIIPSQRAIPEYLLDAKIKSRSRQHYMMANLEVARQDKEAWALLLTPDGYLAEGTGSNVFLVKQNRFELFTPRGINCLRGISRQYVMDIARKQLQIEIIEKDLTLYDVYEATEMFFTCTPFSIMPCTRINGKSVGDGKVGKVTERLTQKWIELVNCDFTEQARVWDGM